MVERTHRRYVQWGETDAAGIVFYPNYFRWFDQATHDLLRALGVPVSSMMEQGYATPLVEAQSRFLAALTYEDELHITSRVSEVRTRAFRVDHTVKRGDQVVCEGYEVRIWVRLGARGAPLEAEPIPTELRRVLAPCEG